MSVLDVGVGKSRMASMYFGKGSMVSSDMRNPAKSTILRAKWNFSVLSVMLWTIRQRDV